MCSCRGSTRICTRRMRLNSKRSAQPGTRASTIRPSPPSTLPSPRWFSRLPRSPAVRSWRSRRCGPLPTSRPACFWAWWPAGRAVPCPRPSSSSPGRRCWWSRRPGAATSRRSASCCWSSSSSSPCPHLARMTPVHRAYSPAGADCDRGPWASRSPSRPSPSLRRSPPCRRSSAATGCAWRLPARSCWSSSIFPTRRQEARSGRASPPTRSTGGRTKGCSPSSKPFSRGHLPPVTCPACSCSRLLRGRCSATSTPSGLCSGSSGRGSCSPRRSIPGTRSGFCPSRPSVETGPGSC